MKIMRVYLCSLVFIVVVYILSMQAIRNADSGNMDFSYINDVTHQINAEYQAGSTEFTQGDDYSLLWVNTENYEATLNKAMNDNCVITDILDGDKLVGKILFTDELRKMKEVKHHIQIRTTIAFGVLFLVLLAMGSYQYLYVTRPFYKLKFFAQNIAAGNLDLPLKRDRQNYFGAFTESFDLMRDELKRARESERAANKSKKELVASLSHDIKTPVSTIKALCEVMEVKHEDSDSLEKVGRIAEKADVIDHLISDMFHSTLEDLQELKITPVDTDARILSKSVEEMNHFNRITITSPLPNCLIKCDELRVVQVIDNIISNSYKYATGNIYVSFTISEQFLVMKIKDEGAGVPDEDMAMITDKFYRGSNVGKQTGSGLGLYLAKHFMEGMDGFLDCYNEYGFVVELRFQLV